MSRDYGSPYKPLIMIGVHTDQTLVRQERARFLSPDYWTEGTCKTFDYAMVEFEPPLEEKGHGNCFTCLSAVYTTKSGHWNTVVFSRMGIDK